jgi:hypothetical protein
VSGTFWTEDATSVNLTLQSVRDTPIYLNQSRAQLFSNCKRKFWFWDTERLELDRPKWALDVGTATHLGLALLGSGNSIDHAVDESKKKLASLMPSRTLPGDIEDLAQHQETVEHLLRGYFAEYEGKTTWHALAQETKGSVEVGDGTLVFLVFRTDKLASWNNRIWIVDHKTAGRLDLRDLLKYDLALQFTAYAYGITKLLKQRVAGVIIDVLVKTKIPQFTRELKTRSDDQLLEFEGEFVEIAKEISWRKRRVENGEDFRTVFYKNTDECFRYAICPYHELCTSDSATRRALYKKREDDYVDAPTRKALESIDVGR